MDETFLQNLPGSGATKATLQEVICAYEAAFPGQIAGYYVEGSYADQTYLPTSDIDIIIVFSGPFADEKTRRSAEQLWGAAPRASDMEVDITILDVTQLQKGVTPTLKLGGRFVYGQDICRSYPLIPLDVWTRERMHAAYWLLVSIYQRAVPVPLLIDFPDSGDEFYGYANRMLRLPDGREVPCTRNLVRTTGWAATALLALLAGQYVGRKRDCARLYRSHIGDEWASLLEEIANFCQNEWQYRIPKEKHARQRLRAICERTRDFERHFLTHYKQFVLEQLRSDEQEPVRFARWVQEHLPLDFTSS